MDSLAVMRSRERALAVYVTMAIGALVLIFVASEVLLSH